MSPRNRLALLIVVAGAHVALLVSFIAPPRHHDPRAHHSTIAHIHARKAVATFHERRVALANAPGLVSHPPSEAVSTSRKRTWDVLWRDQLDRHWRRRYGEDLAAILQMPIDRSWPALERLALEGDEEASEALIELAMLCAEQPPRDTYKFGAALARGLSAADANFVIDGVRAEQDAQLSFAEKCRASGGGPERLRAMLQTRGTAAPVRPGLGGMLELIDAFRRVFAPESESNAMREAAVADALDRVRSEIGDHEHPDFESVFRKFQDDPLVMELLATCYLDACSFRFPYEMRTRFEQRAAELGVQEAIAGVVETEHRSGDLAAAYAWSSFGAWLASRGCTQASGMIDFVNRARELERLRAELPSLQTAGAARSAEELIARLGPAALAAQRCTE